MVSRRLSRGALVSRGRGFNGVRARTTVTNPIDVIKTRAQCFEIPQSLHAVLRGVLHEAGC